jgi:hypothetical protein
VVPHCTERMAALLQPHTCRRAVCKQCFPAVPSRAGLECHRKPFAIRSQALCRLLVAAGLQHPSAHVWITTECFAKTVFWQEPQHVISWQHTCCKMTGTTRLSRVLVLCELLAHFVLCSYRCMGGFQLALHRMCLLQYACPFSWTQQVTQKQAEPGSQLRPWGSWGRRRLLNNKSWC